MFLAFFMNFKKLIVNLKQYFCAQFQENKIYLYE